MKTMKTTELIGCIIILIGLIYSIYKSDNYEDVKWKKVLQIRINIGVEKE